MVLFKFLVVVLVSINLHADEDIQTVIDDFLPGVELVNLLNEQEVQMVILSEAEQNEMFGRQLTESESAKVNTITSQYKTLIRRLIARKYVLQEILKVVKGMAAWDSRLINQLTGVPVGYQMSPVMHEFISKGAFEVQSLLYDVRQESMGLDTRENPWAQEGVDVSLLLDEVRDQEKKLSEWQNSKNTSDETTRFFTSQKAWPGVISLLQELRILRFHQAVERGHRTVVVALLKDSFFDIDARDRDRKTALYKAASRGDYQMVDLLINRGANVNIVHTPARTPLDIVNINLEEAFEKFKTYLFPDANIDVIDVEEAFEKFKTLRESGWKSEEDLLLKPYELTTLERAETIYQAYSKTRNRLIQEGGVEMSTRLKLVYTEHESRMMSRRKSKPCFDI